MEDLRDLVRRTSKPGRVTWIGVRPKRLELVSVQDSVAVTERGLEGDHGTSTKRAVTLVQAEHLAAIASYLGQDAIATELLRRNLVVEGINLLSLKEREVQIGSAVLRIGGICAPCSRMERALGSGGYSAVRGHGGVVARVLVPGLVTVGDAVAPTSL